MFAFRRWMLIGAFLFFTHINTSQASDIVPPPMGAGMKGGMGQADMVPAPVPFEEKSSWYIRGDVGYSINSDPEILEGNIYDLTNESYDESWTLGFGIGSYFTSNVRGDITVDWRVNTDVSSYNPAAASPFGPGPRNFDLESLVVLANVYYDFHNFVGGGLKDSPVRSHFTPYIGFGLGFVTHWTDDGIATGCGCTGIIQSGHSTDVAAAFMAGFAWTWRENLTLDAGYRFLYLGEVKTGQIIDASGGLANGGQDEIDHLHAHEFRVGLRYDIY